MLVIDHDMSFVDRRSEIARLFKFLDRPFDDRIFARMMVPSASARAARPDDPSTVVTGSDMLNEWRKDITPEQIDRTVAMLKRFGLDVIYGPESMPRVADLTQFGIPL